MNAIALLSCLFAVQSPLQPQTVALQFLEGDWKGKATIQLPNGRHEATQTETVRAKHGGRIYVIEGLGKETVDGKERVVHDAFAVVSVENGQPTITAYLADGRKVIAPLHIQGNGFTWGFDYPAGGKIRYTMKLNEKGQWHEIGEFSRDGQRWFKTLEMLLDKVGG